jgi:hypothetical protein
LHFFGYLQGIAPMSLHKISLIWGVRPHARRFCDITYYSIYTHHLFKDWR